MEEKRDAVRSKVWEFALIKQGFLSKQLRKGLQGVGWLCGSEVQDGNPPRAEGRMRGEDLQTTCPSMTSSDPLPSSP